MRDSRAQSEQRTWRLFPYDGPGPYDDDNGGESRWKPGTSPRTLILKKRKERKRQPAVKEWGSSSSLVCLPLLVSMRHRLIGALIAVEAVTFAPWPDALMAGRAHRPSASSAQHILSQPPV